MLLFPKKLILYQIFKDEDFKRASQSPFCSVTNDTVFWFYIQFFWLYCPNLCAEMNGFIYLTTFFLESIAFIDMGFTGKLSKTFCVV